MEDGVLRFVSRNQKALDQRFPQLLTVAKSIKAEKAVIDGEIVDLDALGLPCFEGLRSHEMNCVVVYYAFDLLYLDGRDLTNNPLVTRKAQLKRILPKSNVERIRYTDHVIGPGEKFFQQLERLALEGMVAKRANSIYVGGRTRAWLKIKTEAGRAEM